MKPAVASVGTTHPWNVAGAGLDILVLHELGVRPLTIVAGVSAQDDRSVLALHAVPPHAILAQFAALAEAPVDAFRIGALLSAASVSAVARGVWEARVPIVCDPVIRASDGAVLADEATVAALRRELFARVSVLTPNVPEAEVLVGRRIAGVPDMIEAARAIGALGPRAVLLKGGHVDPPVDVLFDGAEIETYESARIDGDMRGTGCVLAAALAARLAHGDRLRAAVAFAREFVRAKIRAATPLGHGRSAY